MRRALTVIALGVVIALAALWWTGGFDRLAQWAAAHQRAFQNSIALSLRAASEVQCRRTGFGFGHRKGTNMLAACQFREDLSPLFIRPMGQ